MKGGYKPVAIMLIALVASALFVGLKTSVTDRCITTIDVVQVKQSHGSLITVYTGGKPELTLDSYSDLLMKIDGLGLSTKNISKLSFAELKNTSLLLLLGQCEFSSTDLETLAQYVMLCGGSILYLVPTTVTSGSKDFLELFGIQPLGRARDNISCYENKSEAIILSKTWDEKSRLMQDIDSIVIANASALNLTNNFKILARFNLTNTMNISNNKSLPLVYLSPLMWGENTTMAEYKKGYYLYGSNVTLSVSIKLWSGSRVLIISSPHVFADKYLRLPGFDNEKFLENAILWLIKSLENIKVTMLSRFPQDGVLYMSNKIGYISTVFRVTIRDLDFERQDRAWSTNETLISKLGIGMIAGIEYLGILTNVFEPTITEETYNATNKEAQVVVNATANVSYKHSIVVYMRLVVFSEQYGFFWSEQIRFNILVPRVLLGKLHPVVVITAVTLLLSVIFAILLYPSARKYKRSIKEIEEKIRQKT